MTKKILIVSLIISSQLGGVIPVFAAVPAVGSLPVKPTQPTLPTGAFKATLSSLKVSNVLVSDFAVTKFGYSVELPNDASLPVVTATPEDTRALVTITQVTTLPSTATVVVRAGNGATINTYTIAFSKKPTQITPENNTSNSSGSRRRSSGGGSSSSNSSGSNTIVVASNPTVQPVVQVAVANYLFRRDLTIGATGADVTALQNRLVSEGVYSGPVTGYFGMMTLSGVKAYQQKYFILATGYVGPMTRAHLNKGSVAPIQTQVPVQVAIAAQPSTVFASILSYGNTGSDVTKLQIRLTREAVYTGPITGYYGELTIAGVRRYQAKYNLPVNGAVDQATRQHLNTH